MFIYEGWLDNDRLRDHVDERPGVYALWFVNEDPTPRRYVGSSKHVRSRLAQHRHWCRQGLPNNRHLRELLPVLGVKSMRFGVVLYCEEDELEAHEQRLIDEIGGFGQKRADRSRVEKHAARMRELHANGAFAREKNSVEKAKNKLRAMLTAEDHAQRLRAVADARKAWFQQMREKYGV